MTFVLTMFCACACAALMAKVEGHGWINMGGDGGGATIAAAVDSLFGDIQEALKAKL